MDKKDRKVAPGRGTAVGTCVLYFGSSDSWGAGAGGEETRDKAGKAADGQGRMGCECQLEEWQTYRARALF